MIISYVDVKHSVIYDSYAKIAVHELLRWLRIELQQQPAGWVAVGTEVRGMLKGRLLLFLSSARHLVRFTWP